MLYKNGTNIKNLLLNNKTISKAYINGRIVYGYSSGTVLFESSSAGSTSFTVNYPVTVQAILVGGGSGGVYVYSSKYADGAASGGSGGYLNANIKLNPGTYSVTIGSGGDATYIHNSAGLGTSKAGSATTFASMSAGGGGVATANIRGGAKTGGAGGTNSYSGSHIISINSNLSGNKGGTGEGTVNGGASRYESYGKGGNAVKGSPTAGNAGYLKVTVI